MAKRRRKIPLKSKKRRQRRPRKLPVVLKPDEVEALLKAARAAAEDARTPAKQFATWRDFVMVETVLKAGPRVAELCSLEVADVDLTGAILSIIQGKGAKDRNVSIGNKLVGILREWIGATKDGYLFPGPNKKRLSERTFRLRFEALCKTAGIPRNKSHPHALRHTYATMLHRKKVSIRTIQEMLGHESISTTQIYLLVEVADMKDAADRL